jgi:hypothetical protein
MNGKTEEAKEGWELREVMSVMGEEELIRMRHRLGKKGSELMVKILSEEIAEREKRDEAKQIEREAKEGP